MNNLTLDGFRQIAGEVKPEANRLYDLFYVDSNGNPANKVGGDAWVPMTHYEANTARSKFRDPVSIVLVERV